MSVISIGWWINQLNKSVIPIGWLNGKVRPAIVVALIISPFVFSPSLPPIIFWLISFQPSQTIIFLLPHFRHLVLNILLPGRHFVSPDLLPPLLTHTQFKIWNDVFSSHSIGENPIKFVIFDSLIKDFILWFEGTVKNFLLNFWVVGLVWKLFF